MTEKAKTYVAAGYRRVQIKVGLGVVVQASDFGAPLLSVS